MAERQVTPFDRLLHEARTGVDWLLIAAVVLLLLILVVVSKPERW